MISVLILLVMLVVLVFGNSKIFVFSLVFGLILKVGGIVFEWMLFLMSKRFLVTLRWVLLCILREVRCKKF